MNMKNPVFSDKTFSQGRNSDTIIREPHISSSSETLEDMYNGPTATSFHTGRMTLDDTIVKSMLCFGVLLVGAVVGWNVPGLAMVGAIVGMVLAFVNIFKKQISPPLILAYAAFQGLFVGGISAMFESSYPGIVVQAVLATLCVFATVLILFANGKVRTSPKMTKIFLVAMVSYLLFSLVNFGLVVFGATDSAFGLRSAMIPGTGIPFGVVLGVLVILLASYSLVMDFESIKLGIQNGAARNYSWKAAFGLLVTVVWLYVEILRLIAILRE